MSLWLCLRFQQLPLQCLNRSEQQPVVVLERQRVLREIVSGQVVSSQHELVDLLGGYLLGSGRKPEEQ